MKNVRTAYKEYKLSNNKPVDYKTYNELNIKYVKFLMEKVLDGEYVTLPGRLGLLYVTGIIQKPKIDENGNITGLAPNWRMTKELWEKDPKAKEQRKLIYNTNEHTGGIRYKFVWSKKRVLVSNKTLYSLKLTRANKRALYKRIMEGKVYLTTYEQ